MLSITIIVAELRYHGVRSNSLDPAGYGQLKVELQPFHVVREGKFLR